MRASVSYVTFSVIGKDLFEVSIERKNDISNSQNTPYISLIGEL